MTDQESTRPASEEPSTSPTERDPFDDDFSPIDEADLSAGEGESAPASMVGPSDPAAASDPSVEPMPTEASASPASEPEASAQPASHDPSHAAPQSAPQPASGAAAFEAAPAPSSTGFIPPVPTGGRAAFSHARSGKAARPESRRERRRREREALPEHQRASLRTRRILLAVLVVLLALGGAATYAIWQYLITADTRVEQQASTTSDVLSVSEADTKESSSATDSKQTSAPALMGLFGKGSDEALKAIGKGAVVTASVEVNEEGNPVKTRQNVALTEEPTDRSVTPTVYLGLDADGKVVMAGYSGSINSLGYSSSSFAAAITERKLVEKTFAEAGLAIPDGAIVLPAREAYSVYRSDGKLQKENATFQGEVASGQAAYAWTGVVLYDYTAQLATGKLEDTVKQVFIYIQRK